MIFFSNFKGFLNLSFTTLANNSRQIEAFIGQIFAFEGGGFSILIKLLCQSNKKYNWEYREYATP